MSLPPEHPTPLTSHAGSGTLVAEASATHVLLGPCAGTMDGPWSHGGLSVLLSERGRLMTQAQSGDRVKVHYTGRLADGTIFDTSRQREPLEFTLGAGDILPGVEQAVLGMTAGESKSITIPAAHAYGSHQPERVLEIERHHLPRDLHPEVGQHLHLQRQDGGTLEVVVTALTEGHITLDANHPLAGHDLSFDLQLVEIQ
jgi:peptidylprolyl isomerase